MNKVLLAGSAALVGVAALVLVVLSTQSPGSIPGQSQPAQVVSSFPTYSAVSHIAFDEGSGNTAADSINHRDVNLTGASWTTGKFGGAVSFSGSNSYAVEPGFTFAGTPVTVAMWMNASNLSTVLETTANFNSDSQAFGVFYNDTPTCPSNTLGLEIHTSSGYNVKCYNVSTSGWHHYAFIFDKGQNAANEVTLYVDGQVQTAASQPKTTDNSGGGFSTGPLYIMSRGGTGSFSQGSIDDMYIYNGALSTAEVQALFSGKPVTGALPPVVSGVTASAVTDTAATIVWTTDKPADSQVEYGLTTAYGSQTNQNLTMSTSHSMALSGLTANTVYHYRVHSSDASGNDGVSADNTLTTAQGASRGNNKFNINDRVKVTGVARNDPAHLFVTVGGAQSGTEALDGVGTVKDGPKTDSKGNIWYQVAFDDGAVGWDYQTYFVLCTSTTCGTTTSGPYTLSLSTTGSGSVTATCGGVVCPAKIPANTSVLLTAVPSAGASLTSWGGACSGTALTCTVVMSGDKTVSAAFTTVVGAPSTPGTLTANAVSSSQVNLSWGASTGTLTGYHVLRGSTADNLSNFQNVTGGTTFQNTLSVNPSTTYFYAITAYNGTAESAKSNIVSVTTFPGNSTLFAINSKVKTTAQVNVRSTPTIPATGTNVSGTQASGVSGTISSVDASGASITSKQGVYDSANYWWYVTFSSGVSGWVSQTNLVADTTQTTYTLAVSTTGTGSVACSGTGVTSCASIASGSSVTVTATAGTGNKVSSLSVNGTAATCTSGATTCAKTVTVSAAGTVSAAFAPISTSCTTTFCVNDQVQVNSSDGIFVFATAGGAYSPTLPTQGSGAVGTVTAVSTVAGVNWYNVNFNTGTDGWNTENYFLKYAPVTLGVSVAGGSGTVTATCNGSVCPATIGSGAQVSILATPSAGYALSAWTSTPSGLCTGTTNPCVATITANSTIAATFAIDITPPTIPTSLTGSASGSSVNLTWTASTDANGVAGYKIYRGSTQIATSPSNSYTDTSTSPSTSYTYSVAAYDGAGNVSSQSSQITVTTGVQAASPISANRSVDWSNAGVKGGIPTNRPTCVTLTTVTAKSINDALSSCSARYPSGSIVALPKGTFSMSTGISATTSNVTLKGQGADQTILSFQGNASCRGFGADVCVSNPNQWWVGNVGIGDGDGLIYPGGSHDHQWTGGYAQHNDVITLDKTTGMTVGMQLILDQDDDASRGPAFTNCHSEPTCSLEGDDKGGQPPGRTISGRVRSQQQYVTVTGINGNNVTISPGLYAPNWSSSKNPRVFWVDPISGFGIEGLTLDNSITTANGVVFVDVWNSWVKNVRSLKGGRNHIWMYLSSNITIQDSYFVDQSHAGSQSYGVETWMSGNDLVMNNIFQHIYAATMLGPSSGMVIAYNFGTDGYTGDASMSPTFWATHDSGVMYNLFEGNEATGLSQDLFHGNGNTLTAFRNWFSGNETGKSNYKYAFRILSASRYPNFVGNVLGTAGVQNCYESGPSGSGSGTCIYDLGNGNANSTVSVPSDSLVHSTAMRWGNYDTVSGKVVWNNAEVPTGLTDGMANPLPGQKLPDSLFLSSQPAFWTAGKPWPPIGPDKTLGPGPGGYAYHIPARDCYYNVMKGTELSSTHYSFNAANCYAGY